MLTPTALLTSKQIYAYCKLCTAACFNESWLKFHEECDNAETCRSQVIGVHRL